MPHQDLSPIGGHQSLSSRRRSGEGEIVCSMVKDNSSPCRGTYKRASNAVLTMARENRSTELLDLPNEILLQIFRHLNSSPPSVTNRLRKPEYDITSSCQRSYKDVCRVCTHLRLIVLPLLFRHAQLDPYRVSHFLDFIDKNGIARHVITLTTILQGPCSHIHPAWWSSLFDRLPNLTTLTVLAAPHVFSEFGGVPVDNSHSWAFKIPYHIMSLSYDPKPVTWTNNTSSSIESTSKSEIIALEGPTLLSSRPWTSFVFNESSHLAAYSTYEYFLKTPPSLLAAFQLHHYQHQSHLSSLPSVCSISAFLSGLVTFSYIAIFPFYNHIDEVLKVIRRMTQLRRLFVKLCPNPESTVLQDELERNGANAGRTEGRIDVNDPWNEFETAYSLIPHTIIHLTTEGCLEEFETDDVKMVGIRETLIDDINRQLHRLSCWSHVNEGLWRRDTVPRS